MNKEAYDIDVLLADFEEALEADKINIAFNLLKNMQLKAVKDKQLREQLAKIEPLQLKCQERYTRVKIVLDDMNRDKDWVLVTAKKDITVYHRETTDGFITNKASVFIPLADKLQIPSAFVRLLSLITEVDLMPAFFPKKYMKSNELLYETSQYSKHFHMKFNPGQFVPLSKRDGVAVGHGYDLSESGEIVITYDTLPEGQDDAGVLVPGPEAKYQRLEASGAFYFAIQKTGIMFSVINRVDLNLKIIPQMIQQFMSKHLWSEYVYNVRKTLKFYDGSKWEQRVKDNKEFYDMVHQCIVDCLNLDVSSVINYEQHQAQLAELSE